MFRITLHYASRVTLPLVVISTLCSPLIREKFSGSSAFLAIAYELMIFFPAISLLSFLFTPIAEYLKKKNAPIVHWVTSGTIFSFSYFFVLNYVFHQPHRIDFSGYQETAVLISSIAGGVIAGWFIGKTYGTPDSMKNNEDSSENQQPFLPQDKEHTNDFVPPKENTTRYFRMGFVLFGIIGAIFSLKYILDTWLSAYSIAGMLAFILLIFFWLFGRFSG